MESAYSLTSQDWTNFLRETGASTHVLKFLLEGLYQNREIWERHLSRSTVALLQERFDLSLPQVLRTQKATDGTIKFQLGFQDGKEVETVLIPFHKRFTVCLSTQVGCAMNCSFCYTGTQGLKRHLTPGEIVGQYLVARNHLRSENAKALTPSIVFMGQGEPLHNAEAVVQALKVLGDTKVLGVGHRQMTLSTVGYLPALDKLKEFPRINLALSLHSPFEEERSQLIPVNQRFPLSEVMRKLDEIPLLPRQFITYEYLLVKDFNMSEAHAEALGELLATRPALVNLIPFNPFPGSRWQRPSAEDIETFKEKLVSRRLRVMVRQTKGDEILAACGQLKTHLPEKTHAL